MNDEEKNLLMAIEKLEMDIKSLSSQDTDTQKIFKKIENEAESLQGRARFGVRRRKMMCNIHFM